MADATPEQREQYEQALRDRAVRAVYDLDLDDTSGAAAACEIRRPYIHSRFGPDVFPTYEKTENVHYIPMKEGRTLEEQKRALCQEWGLPWHEGTVTELRRQPRDWYFDTDSENGEVVTRPLTDQLKIDGSDV